MRNEHISNADEILRSLAATRRLTSAVRRSDPVSPQPESADVSAFRDEITRMASSAYRALESMDTGQCERVAESLVQLAEAFRSIGGSHA